MTKTVNAQGRPESVGSMYARTFEVDISNYDDDGSGDGESFTVNDALLQNRFFTPPFVRVVDDSGYVARYNVETNSIRLYESAGSQGELTEVASDGNNSATLEVTCLGW